MHTNKLETASANMCVAKPAKQIIIGNYMLGTTIGKGNSAVVKIATHLITKQKVILFCCFC
jgi:hypothetical protein